MLKNRSIRNFSLIIFLCILLGFIVYKKSFKQGMENRLEPVALSKAPEWTLEDLDGNAFSSSLLEGNVVLLHFWASWCAICRSEIPTLIRLQDRYGSEGFKVVAICMDASEVEKIKDFVQAQNMDYLILRGSNNATIAEKFNGVHEVPFSFFIDRNGNIKKSYKGALPEEEVRTLIEEMI